MAKNMQNPSIMVRAVKQNRLKRIVRCKKIHRLKQDSYHYRRCQRDGLATAHLMQEAGWHIVRVDWDEEALIESKRLENGLALVCDISDPEAVTI